MQAPITNSRQSYAAPQKNKIEEEIKMQSQRGENAEIKTINERLSRLEAGQEQKNQHINEEIQ